MRHSSRLSLRSGFHPDCRATGVAWRASPRFLSPEGHFFPKLGGRWIYTKGSTALKSCYIMRKDHCKLDISSDWAVQRFNVLFAPKRRLRPVSTLGRELIAPVEADGAMGGRYLTLGHGVQGGWSRRLEYIHPQGLLSPT